ncbi:hypothetical protein [Ekhidna sp.]|uniref:hypothetical protein n=1 Tax=Ekhidna sp. TaxID=2608089 RepID=UPI003CCBCA43
MSTYQRLFFTFICIASSFLSFTQEGLQEVYKAGTDAYKADDYQTFLTNMKLADELRPNHPTILYNLGVALALTGDEASAVETLRKVAWMNAEMPFDSDEDLESLKDYEPFQALITEVNELKQPISSGSVAFEINNKSLHPEGVAYSSKQKKYYIGGVHNQTIISVDRNGNAKEFTSEERLMAIMGLQVDEKRNLLWACSTPAPEMSEYEEGLVAEVLSFDLKTGKLVGSYAAPHSQAWLGDLLVSNDGVVYVSSSSAEKPAIYVVNEADETLEVLIEPKELVSLQGLAFNSDESALFFSDYRFGLFRYDISEEKLSSITSNIQHPLKGIDGLYYYKGDLIAVHNGLRPFRIVRYSLNASEDEIDGYTILEKALPGMNEPTLGTIVGNEFHYVFNSPWGAYDENMELQIDEVENPIIRKITLHLNID